MDTEELLRTYPRQRPPLSPEFEKVYLPVYLQSRDGATLAWKASQALEAWMHRKVARRSGGGPVLELGAGTLNHLRFEPPTAAYDVVEPWPDLYKGREERGRVRAFYSDISEIPPATRYRHIISIASLEHIVDLPVCLARCGLMLEPGGGLSAGIPSEGGFLWGFSWRASVGLLFRLKTGMNYGELISHEHVNEAPEIIKLTRLFFRKVRVTRFPLPWHHASLYAFIQAEDPDRDLCGRYLRQLSSPE